MGSRILSAASQSLVRLPGPPSAHPSKLASTSSSSIACSRFSFSRALTLRISGARQSWPLVVPRASGGDETVDTLDPLEAEVSEDADREEEQAEERPKRPPIVKLGDIMGILHKRAIEASEAERPVPDIRVGDVVEIKLQSAQRRRRFVTYKGIVMSRQNAGIHTTIRFRRIIAGIGVEIVLPLYSPNVKAITVLKHRKVRRARLYYLRDKLPRFSTFK